MDSTEIIIARLVLGYLKSEGCRSAYKEFLRTSSNLRDTGLSKSKYLSTRFVGLTLEDILSEYFEIYKIVQGGLEATNYYNECHSKNTLVEQLLYLLNKVQSSRMSTPCPRSPPESILDATSPSHVDPVSDIETTPVHTLPGNIRCTSENSYLHKGIRRKSHSKYPKSDSKASLSMANKDDMSEVLAQTLLENKEFHENIAQTINKYAEKKRIPGELDKTIKSVVRETEENPIFDKILDEIIGYTTIIDANKGVESGSTSSSTAKRNSEQYESHHQKRVHQHSDSSESHDPNYMSGPDPKKMEEQNNEAIQSIIANSRLTSDPQTENQEPQSNNEVIVFDGSLDKYLISNTCNANTQTQPLQNPLYINATGNFLMMPSANSAGNIQIDGSKQYYFVNKQSTVGWNLPTLKTPSVITEQDILAMPTVIVNDDKHAKIVVSTHSLLQTPVLTTVTPPLQPIIPKPMIEIPAGYMSDCNTVNTQQSCVKTAETIKGTASNGSVTSTANTSKTNTKNTEGSAKSLPSDLLTDAPKELPKLVSEPTPDVVNDDKNVKTPTPPQPVQKSTPKSGSHVRNLDFSTPPKITSTQKKLMKSNRLKTPPPTQKKQAAKMLFKSQTDTKISKKTDNSREVKSDIKRKRKLADKNAWDADLRALALAEKDDQTPKKIQDSKVIQTAKKRGRKKGSLKEKMNTTEHDAALLEAALKTPVKSNIKSDDVIKTEEQTDKKSVLNNKGDKQFDNNEKSINGIKETEVRSSKKREFTNDNSSKMILSPSKLNASKRNFVSVDLTGNNKDSKFLTPEMVRDNFHQQITHAKNINLLLDTPAKTDIIPKTPGPKTPMDPSIDPNLSLTCSLFTPLTKEVLEANLKGFDINSLPTPSMPITPGFPPFTPTIDLISPYSNRPTDYSTSSSYYQPSDYEQNRSLEANIIEFEKRPIKIHSDILLVKEEVAVSSEDKVDNGSPKKQILSSTTLSEHLNIFNKNVIGKKNLNLMKKNVSSSSSEESSSDTTSDDDDHSKSWDESNSNTTVINRKKPDTPKRSYSLRNRTTNINNQEDAKKKAETKEVASNKKQPTKGAKTKSQHCVDAKKPSDVDLQPITTDTNEKEKEKPLTKNNAKSTPQEKLHSKNDAKSTPQEKLHAKNDAKSTPQEKLHTKYDTKSTPLDIAQQKMLTELEEKRLRTIDKFKTNNKVQKKPARPPSSKFLKIKPIPNLNTRRKPRKSDSPKKTVQKAVGKIEKTDSKMQTAPNNSKNDSLPIDLSRKEDKTKPRLNVDIKQTKNVEKIQNPTCDVEAQNLIEGLKERGIHLMQNKSSPIKKNSTSTVVSEEIIEGDKKESASSNSTEDASKRDSHNMSGEAKETSRSTSQLASELRDVYDTCAFEEENEHVIFDEKSAVKSFNEYDMKVLTKTFLGKVYVEEIGEEIDVPLSVTPFIVLLDIPPTSETTQKEDKISQKRENKVGRKEPDLIKDVNSPFEDRSKLDDDLMNYAIVGSVREENSDDLDSPKSKKRKLRDEENSHTEKKCKTLLKKINVDSFLNNIHGGS